MSLILKLENMVKEKMSNLKGSVHSYEHVDRVFKIATFLSVKEKADVELVQIGAILHDIGHTMGEPHNKIGAELASKILGELNYPQEKSEKIAKIIACHNLSSNVETLEEKIVWDADKIDLLGAIGIARTFHEGGSRNIPFEEGVKFCNEVLKPIYNRLHTQTAKEIIKKRYNELKSFLSALEMELSISDLGCLYD